MTCIKPYIAISLAALLSLIVSGCDKWISIAYFTNKTITDNWPERYAQAIQWSRKDDCDKSWKILWPRARRGDQDALYLLSEMMFEGMVISKNLRYKPDAFNFYVYSVGSSELYSIYNTDQSQRFRRSDFLNKFRNINLDNMSPVYQCMKIGQEADCVSKYQVLGTISSFKDFAHEIENQTRGTGRIAECVIFPG